MSARDLRHLSASPLKNGKLKTMLSPEVKLCKYRLPAGPRKGQECAFPIEHNNDPSGFCAMHRSRLFR